MLAMVRADECDVAVGSRFLPDSGQDGERYKPAPERVVGTSLLRLLMRLRLGQPISDGTSRMYAVNHKALDLLADPYVCEAPEVEALMRITDARLRLVEVPVHMRRREHGESSFRGRRAVELVVTIGLTLFAGELCAAVTSGGSRRQGVRGLLPRRLIAERAERSAATPASRPRAPDLARRVPGPQQGVGAASSLASRSRCEARPANAAQPWRDPPAAVPTAPSATAAEERVAARAGLEPDQRARPRRARGDDVVDVDHRPRHHRGPHGAAAERRHHRGGEQRVGDRIDRRHQVARLTRADRFTSSDAPIAPPRSPSAASSTAGGRSSLNRCGIIASRIRSTYGSPSRTPRPPPITIASTSSRFCVDATPAPSARTARSIRRRASGSPCRARAPRRRW